MDNKYSLKDPLFFTGDLVVFQPHNKSYTDSGDIIGVVTHYSAKHVAYHIYTIHRPSYKRHMHVAERNIIEKTN